MCLRQAAPIVDVASGSKGVLGLLRRWHWSFIIRRVTEFRSKGRDFIRDLLKVGEFGVFGRSQFNQLSNIMCFGNRQTFTHQIRLHRLLRSLLAVIDDGIEQVAR